MNQLSPEARRLFRLARSADEPSPAALHRIERSLAARIAKGVGVAAAGALWAPDATGTLLTTTKIVSIAVVAGALSAVGVYRLQQPRIPATPAAAAVSAMQQVARTSKPANQVTEPTPVDASPSTSEITPPAPVVSVSRSVARQPSATPSAPAAREAGADQLSDETRELRRAQQALRSGDEQLALQLLDQQDRTYGSGVLQEERSAARVLALCRNGQATRAQSEAGQFERRWPKSALLARVRSACF